MQQIGGRHAICKNDQIGNRERGHRCCSFIFSNGCNELTDGIERRGNARDSEGQAVYYLPRGIAAE